MASLRAKVKLLGAAFQNQASKIQTLATEHLARGAEHVRDALEQASPKGVTGDLKHGWILAPDPPGIRFAILNTARANDFPYVHPVEEGRRAAPVPIDPLEEWVQVVLGIAPPESRSVAFAISRKKATTPTPGQRFVEEVLARELPRTSKIVAARMLVDTVGVLRGKRSGA